MRPLPHREAGQQGGGGAECVCSGEGGCACEEPERDRERSEPKVTDEAVAPGASPRLDLGPLQALVEEVGGERTDQECDDGRAAQAEPLQAPHQENSHCNMAQWIHVNTLLGQSGRYFSGRESPEPYFSSSRKSSGYRGVTLA